MKQISSKKPTVIITMLITVLTLFNVISLPITVFAENDDLFIPNQTNSKLIAQDSTQTNNSTPKDKKIAPQSVKVFGYLNAPGQAKVTSIGSYIVRFINFLSLLIGSFGILAIIIGGLFLLTAGGKEESITKGKDIIKLAITGIIISVSAFWIVSIIQDILY